MSTGGFRRKGEVDDAALRSRLSRAAATTVARKFDVAVLTREIERLLLQIVPNEVSEPAASRGCRWLDRSFLTDPAIKQAADSRTAQCVFPERLRNPNRPSRGSGRIALS